MANILDLSRRSNLPLKGIFFCGVFKIKKKKKIYNKTAKTIFELPFSFI